MTLEILITKLEEVTSSHFLDFNQVKKVNESGLYLIYFEDELIYVGKTDRNGNVRMRELASDFRSHTLNRKLLHLELCSILKKDLNPLNSNSKKRLISSNYISSEDFQILQKRVNNMVKNKFKFKFYNFEGRDLLRLEHFAIAVLNPKMND